jgi:hypothetical protein
MSSRDVSKTFLPRMYVHLNSIAKRVIVVGHCEGAEESL